jgi:malate dehydrogenase (oxaloacetate-decarboxylating)(NADP+)
MGGIYAARIGTTLVPSRRKMRSSIVEDKIDKRGSFLPPGGTGGGMGLDQDALEYHARDPPGKIAMSTTKPTNTQRDLSLAYSPGVAAPCRRIDDDEDDAYAYTAKGNLVGVISNGSAVLGLGDIGAQASKPVMEGKGVLFKRFADIDVFDIELDTADPEAFAASVAAMEPTFGGINLEDIKAPACFEIERLLRARMDIPVFHDDQHGTAIISGAALLNAAEIADKPLGELEVVFSGAGASAIASAKFYVSLGVHTEHITMCDSSGIITEERAASGDVNEYKAAFAQDVPEGDLADAMAGADVFVGLSVPDIVSPEMIRSMAPDPIVFAMANPDPEIGYHDAKAAREDTVIMATGRSDFPNQVNNVLGFPFIFRGALDVRATEINEDMKVAAAHALADLARRDVPDEVVKAYGDQPLRFGPEYIIPKPVDSRVLFEVAPAVARAAVESGCARTDIDFETYRERLEARLGKSREMMRIVLNKAKSNPKRVALAEGDDEKMIRAAYQLVESGIAEPVLIGDREGIGGTITRLGFDFDPEIVDPDSSDHTEYGERLYELRKRKGITESEAHDLVGTDPNYLGSVMVECGNADALLTGLTHHYPSALRPPLEVIGTSPDAEYVSGVYLLAFRNRVVFCADTTVNQDPDEEVLAEVARHTADLARRFNIEPRVAMLSYSNFGSVDTEGTRTVSRAATQLREDPDADFPVDGEMQADTALVEDILTDTYEFAELDSPANVLVFPNLEAGNIGYKLLQRLGGADAIGPMLVGMDKPVHVLQRGDEVKDIVNLAGVAVTEAQTTAESPDLNDFTNS